MKRCSYFFLILYFALFFFSCTSNKKQTFVFDIEHDLTQDQIIILDSLYKSHEKKTSNEIALITTPDYGSDTSLLFFAVNFGRKLGIGKKDKNNGVVIVFSRVKSETMISTGYGTEKVLKDEIAKKIIDSLMIPNFKQGKYFDGLWEGSKEIVRFLERPENKIN